MRIALLLAFCSLFLANTRAQNKIQLVGDFNGAPRIEVNKAYSSMRSPVGFGKVKEFKLNPRRNSHIFREERNSAWFLIEAPFNGTLTFDLQPHQLKDDYDWMLFTDIEKRTPVRSNNARNDLSQSSKTGMSNKGRSSFVNPGPGNNYSLPLGIKKGVKLALVIDNIYGGKGFDLIVKVQPDISEPLTLLEGNVKDRHSLENLSAEITVEDDTTGMVIGKYRSDPQTGKYKIEVPINRSVNITASHPAYLFVTIDTIISQHSELNFWLDAPVSGNRLVLKNIHFFPNRDEILSSSMPELERLLLFLKERPEWTVKITGHTNPNVFASAKYLQQLSFDRAIAVKTYLVKNSISEKRISCAGLGGKAPLVITKDTAEGLRNLRVEITLLKK